MTDTQLVFNKDILGVLYDHLEDDVNFLLFVKQNNIKVKEGIKWRELNWCSISERLYLSEEFMEEFSEYLEWNAIAVRQKLTERFIYKYGNELDWGLISQYQTLSEKFMSNNSEDLNWASLCYNQKMSDDFIIKHQKDIDWEALLDSIASYSRNPLSEKVLKICYIYFDETCWESLIEKNNWELTEDFLRTFFQYFDTDLLSHYVCYNDISEDFIEEYKDELSMYIILNSHHDLSDEFIRRHSLFY